jgi:hypothetical protein
MKVMKANSTYTASEFDTNMHIASKDKNLHFALLKKCFTSPNTVDAYL